MSVKRVFSLFLRKQHYLAMIMFISIQHRDINVNVQSRYAHVPAVNSMSLLF